MDYQNCSSLVAMFFEQAERLDDRPFLWAKRDGAYQSLSWAEVAKQVRDLSRGLRDLGLSKGERVVLVSENRPEWLITDLAIMAAGAITVPAYTTNTPHDHNHILTDSGAVGAIVSTQALARRVLPAAIEAPDCKWAVGIEDLDIDQAMTLDAHQWNTVVKQGADLPDDVAVRVAEAQRDDVACFIYTSGTGGAPKGVMLSHGNILCNCMGAEHLLRSIGLGHEIFLCFLPLSHSYEHMAGQFFPISIGAEIYYGEGVDQLLNNLAEVRPTIMTAVPRLYESMHQRIQRGIQKEKGLKAKLFALALRLGYKKHAPGGRLSVIEKLQDLVVDRLVRGKIRARFGGRLKAMVSGGAALNVEIGNYFQALGLPILQGYGQTEASPLISANRPEKVKMETVGPPVKGVEVKIANDGEILARGEMVMKGYWGNEEATTETVRDGWLHTGDIGELDSDGYIRITDRKKDIIVLSGGDNCSPARVEGFLTLEPEIAQALVYGDKRPHLVALIVPDDVFLRAWAHEHGKAADLASLDGDEDLRKAISDVVDRINKRLSNLEKIRRFAISPEVFTTENEMMTPTLKLRRHIICQVHGDRLEALYEKKK